MLVVVDLKAKLFSLIGTDSVQCTEAAALFNNEPIANRVMPMSQHFQGQLLVNVIDICTNKIVVVVVVVVFNTCKIISDVGTETGGE